MKLVRQRIESDRKTHARGPKTARIFRRFKTQLLLIVGCLGFVIWSGSQREAADATKPLRLVDPQQTSVLDRPSFRIGTFNIHSGKGQDGLTDLDRVAKWLTNFDFVALNEVRGATDYRQTQAAVLGKKLNMAALFAATERRWWHGHVGNGLLTKAQLTSWQVIPLVSTDNHKFRNAILTSIRHEDATVRILLTHLDTRRDRAAQLQAVIQLFLALDEPAILMGDLNTTAADPLLHSLLRTPGVTDALQAGISKSLPESRIDWIITRGLRCLDAGYENTDASDHPVVWTQLQFDSPLSSQSSTVPVTESIEKSKHD